MNGSKDAQMRRKELRQKMTPAQVEEGQRRARAFMAHGEEALR
jgi:hypothetical protein